MGKKLYTAALSGREEDKTTDIPKMSKKRLISFKNIVLTIIAVSLVIGFFLPVFSKWHKLREKNTLLEKKIEAFKKANAELRENIYKLQSDPIYVENVARKKMKKSRPGEIIYKTE